MSENERPSNDEFADEPRFNIDPDVEFDADDANESADANADAAAEGEAGGAMEDSSESALIEQLKGDIARLEQDKLRAAADYQNLARRATLNEKSAREQVLLDLAKQLVTVLDHFDRALEHGESASAESVLQGVAIVREELIRMLERFGIQQITAEPGEPFDPNRHEAMLRQASDEVEAGHVVMQLQPGYALEEKTVRPTQVAIAE